MSAIQLVVRQRNTNVSITVNLTQASQQADAGEDDVDTDLIRATGAACVGSISSLARSDGGLEEDVSESLQMSTDGDVASANYGNALRSKGDVLHYGSLLSRASDELQRGVDEFTDYEARDENPTEAIGNMLEVAKVVFDVKHEGQQGTFNSGRLATMFCVVYKFCIKYIQCHGIAKILPLIKHLVPEVVTFLVKIGFLKWVTDTGGWAIIKQLTLQNYYISAVFNQFPRLGIAIGVLWMAWKLKKYFWP